MSDSGRRDRVDTGTGPATTGCRAGGRGRRQVDRPGSATAYILAGLQSLVAAGVALPEPGTAVVEAGG